MRKLNSEQIKYYQELLKNSNSEKYFWYLFYLIKNILKRDLKKLICIKCFSLIEGLPYRIHKKKYIRLCNHI